MTAENKYHNYSIKDLHDQMAIHASHVKAQSGYVKEIQAEIDARLTARLKTVLDQQGKDTGAVSISLDDGGTAKLVVSKSVSYDSTALMNIVAQLPWDQANSLFAISVGLPEKNYPGLAASPELKQAVDAARTVEPKVGKVQIVYPDPA